MITTRERLDPAIFDLPVEKMRAGYYTDAYFNHTRATLLEDGRHPQRRACRSSRSSDAYLGGMDEAIAILKLCADDWDDADGARALRRRLIEPYETGA